MSLSVDGVWAGGTWAPSVWADGVWREGEQVVAEIAPPRATLYVEPENFTFHVEPTQ